LIKPKRNATPKIPRAQATIPDGRGMYFLNIPMVPKITIERINEIFALVFFSTISSSRFKISL
jgi:hypothetical protein